MHMYTNTSMSAAQQVPPFSMQPPEPQVVAIGAQQQFVPQLVPGQPSPPLLLQQQPRAASTSHGSMWVQGVQQQQQVGVGASVAAQPQASTTYLDVSALRTVLPDLLGSLPPLEAAASSTPVVLQVQMQQAAPVVLQPAQQQQVYTLPSGEQLLLGGTTAGTMQQQHTPGAYVGNTAAVSADGAGGRIVLVQPLQEDQSSYCSTGTGQHTQAVIHTVGIAANSMPGAFGSSEPYGQPLSAGGQQLGVGSSWQVVSESCSSTPYGMVQLPVGSGTSDNSSSSAAERPSVVCILSGPSAPSPPAGGISSQQQQGVATGSRLMMGHQPTPTGSPGSSSSGSYGRMQQRVFWRSGSGLQAAVRAPSWQAAAGAGAGPRASAAAAPARVLPGPWADLSLDAALPQLWSNEQVQQARGGRLSNTALRAAWYAADDPELCAQDMYDFRKLKHVLHKIDAKHSVRLNLIKRLHAVADYGGCDLKAVYFEVRCVIGTVMRSCVGRLDGARVTGLVRLAVVLQEALALGPREVAGPAVAVEQRTGQ